MAPATPYYVIDERKLLRNLRIIRRVREESGAKSLLALKCFSAWCVFGLMKQYMDGTTSSSLFEARLGSEKFGGETHAYCAAWSDDEILKVRKHADAIIFNSVSQLKRFRDIARNVPLGIRINPGVSYSHYDLADPARRFSRLGVTDRGSLETIVPLLSGCMFHFNCENGDFRNFALNLERIGRRYGGVLRRLDWVSLGGGLAFTKKNYPLERFCAALKGFSRRFGVQVYLEPGEAAVTGTTELVTTVLDVVRNGIDIAIVDASIEAHTLDHLIYRTNPAITLPRKGAHRCMVAGRSCLAGDVFGTYRFASLPKTGSAVRIADAGGYTMVKKNWFNGVAMPSIAVRRLNGKTEVVKTFDYSNFLHNLS
ncbi:MAG: carboxynorspermidine decarboxylase [Chitinispirillaceae bacterium]|nr:carboxynorspermidine decarboxylase [Chitinispirillaceae bacterium]